QGAGPTEGTNYISWSRQELLPYPPVPPPPPPPPPPTWTLSLHAGPAQVYQWNANGTIAVEANVNTLTYMVSPDWNASLTQTITTNQPSFGTSVTLPVPSGSIKTVTVTVSGKWASNGGLLYNGIYACPLLPATDNNIVGASTKVAFQGTNEN